MGAFTAFCEGVPISGGAVAVVFYAHAGGCIAFCGRFAAVGVVLYRVRACGGWCSCRGLFVFLPIVCGLHVAVFGSSSYYMEKFKPVGVGADVPGRRGCWCSVFVEKTNKEKKTRKRVKILIKSVDTDTETYYYTITDTETC